MTQTPNLTGHTRQAGQGYASSLTVAEIAGRLAQQVDTVSAYLLPNGKRNGSCWVAGSIHGDKGKSLRVVLSGEKTGRWMDHADDSYHGDLLDLWADTKGLSTAEAIREAKDYLGIHHAVKASPAPQRRNVEKKTVVPKPQKGVTALKADGDVYRYLVEERKLQPEVLKCFKVAEMIHPKQGPVIVFPYLAHDGSRVMIKYLPLERKEGKHPWTSKDSAKTLFGWQTLPENCKTVVITEGEIDAITLAGFGIPALSIPFGAGKQTQVEWIENDLGRLEQFEEIIVWMDDDEAGRATALVIAQRLGIERCRLALASHGCNDPNEMLQKGCEEADFHECIEAAKTAKPAQNPLESWPEREPLPERYDVMPFDYELLPAKLRPYIELGTHTMQCPPDYIATSCMVALGSLIGRKVCIRPKKRDDWVVIPNLWGGNVGLSTAMKSPAQDFGMRHLERIANKAIEIHKEEQRLSAPQRRRLEAEIHALSQKLKNHYRDSSKSEINPEMVSEDLAKREAELEELNDQHATRYWTTDSTIEKLAVLLNQNPNGLLNKRDELIGWLRSMDRPGREGDRAFFLESASGTQSITHDRIGRGTIHCEGLCLSIHGSIQPGPLQHYVTDALGDGVGADGLLQRFQLMVWPDPIKQWRYVDESLESANDALAASVFDHLVDITAESVGATVPEDGVPYLRFSDEAQEVFIQWFTELHREKVSNAEHEALRSHLGKYSSLMPSLALILHLADGHTGPVSMEAAVKAADWCEYLGTHARRVYLSNTRPDVMAAHRILRKVEDGTITHGMKVRDVSQRHWSGLDRNNIREGLSVLEDHGWVRVEEIETGGRPSPVILFHPDLRDE